MLPRLSPGVLPRGHSLSADASQLAAAMAAQWLAGGLEVGSGAAGAAPSVLASCEPSAAQIAVAAGGGALPAPAVTPPQDPVTTAPTAEDGASLIGDAVLQVVGAAPHAAKDVSLDAKQQQLSTGASRQGSRSKPLSSAASCTPPAAAPVMLQETTSVDAVVAVAAATSSAAAPVTTAGSKAMLPTAEAKGGSGSAGLAWPAAMPRPAGMLAGAGGCGPLPIAAAVDSSTAELAREIAVMKRLAHPNVVALHEVGEGKVDGGLITHRKACKGVSTVATLQSRGGTSLLAGWAIVPVVPSSSTCGSCQHSRVAVQMTGSRASLE